MSKDDIMVIKNLSKAKNSPDSPWNSDKDPFNWMWLKTCLIQHSKFLPKTQELIKAIEIDNHNIVTGKQIGRASCRERV